MRNLNKSSIFFTIFKEKDKVSLEEIYILCKREQSDKEKDRVWISNKLVAWKKRGIAEPTYGTAKQKNGWLTRQHLLGIKLTEDGKRLLSRDTKELHTEGKQDRAEEAMNQAEENPIIDPDTMQPPEQVENDHTTTSRKIKISFDDIIKAVARLRNEWPRI